MESNRPQGIVTEPADIHLISADFSEGVRNENVVNNGFAEQGRCLLKSAATLDEYLSRSPSIAFREYEPIVERLGGKPLKVLDIGVGRGESSLYLASRGCKVWALEPSEGFCRLICEASRKFDLALTVLQGVAEDLDRAGEFGFDAVFFNASLHHCDAPMKALAHCYEVLKPGGKLFLSAELHIRPWIRKKRWYTVLRENPRTLGHYGGNEHAYYNWEYVSMLRRAGFQDVRPFPLASACDSLFRLRRILSDGAPAYSDLQVAARAFYYAASARFVRHGLLFRTLARLSLVPSQFSGTKPCVHGE